MNVLDVIIILAYFVGMIVLGLIANKKQTGVDDYYLGGRSMGAFKIGALWMAGWIGGSSVIGTSSNSYSMGITGVWYVGEIAIGCVLFALVMAKPVKRASEVLQNITFPELIHARYDQKNSTMASITTILAMIGYTAAQFVAGASILNVLTGWNLGVCYILAAVVIVFYVSTGGLLAVTYTDIVQMALLLLGIVVLAVPLVGAQLHKMGANLVTDLPASFFDLGAWGWPTILALGLSTIMSFFTSMDSYTRCFAAKNERVARDGALWAGLGVFFIAIGATIMGMAAKVLLPELPAGSSAYAALVAKFFPVGVSGLVLVGVFAAIMSTGVVCINVCSANISVDIYKDRIKPDAPDRKVMVLGIVSSLVVGVIGALLAWWKYDIIELLLLAFTFQASALFFPTVCGVFWKKPTAKASSVSMIVSLAVVLLWLVGDGLGWGKLFAIDALWPGLLSSGVVFFVMTLTTKPTEADKQRCEIFFANPDAKPEEIK